jgi:poly-beta-1,6-N-acetyl-D-glucosamine N-deacetylase
MKLNPFQFAAVNSAKWLLIIYFLSHAIISLANNSAVFLVYHRFGENQYPSTNIRLDQFKKQMHLLKQDGYQVLPVTVIINRLKRQQSLPDKTVGIVVDDAYQSVYTTAWPIFKHYHFPFTLFVATQAVDHAHGNILSWQEIRQMARAGVTIGNHTASHGHLAQAKEKQLTHELQYSQQRFKKELGFRPKLFAYPYGEYSPMFRDTVKRLGFIAAFTQSSGVAHSHSDFFALPRFPINEKYGEIERFRMISKALPIHIKNLSPDNPIIIHNNPPQVTFTILDQHLRLSKLKCFASGQGQTTILQQGNHITVKPRHAFAPGRNRINCTVPGVNGRYHWLGIFFLVLK